MKLVDFFCFFLFVLSFFVVYDRYRWLSDGLLLTLYSG